MPLGRSESLPLGLAMDLSYAATPLAGNQRHTPARTRLFPRCVGIGAVYGIEDAQAQVDEAR
jgi:hypothetical protein